MAETPVLSEEERRTGANVPEPDVDTISCSGESNVGSGDAHGTKATGNTNRHPVERWAKSSLLDHIQDRRNDLDLDR
jgi:hypothetical protein